MAHARCDILGLRQPYSGEESQSAYSCTDNVLAGSIVATVCPSNGRMEVSTLKGLSTVTISAWRGRRRFHSLMSGLSRRPACSTCERANPNHALISGGVCVGFRERDQWCDGCRRRCCGRTVSPARGALSTDTLHRQRRAAQPLLTLLAAFLGLLRWGSHRCGRAYLMPTAVGPARRLLLPINNIVSYHLVARIAGSLFTLSFTTTAGDG